MFEASEVKWKYLYHDENGDLRDSEIPPENKKMLAPLLLSKGFGEEDYQAACRKIAAEGFCACVPLNHRTESYIILPNDGTFPTSPQEGASQLIDAMNKGYDVIDFNGGTCMEQKLILVKDYFRSHPLPAQKIKFWGFSNGGSPMLYLSDVLQQIHGPSAGNTFFSSRNRNVGAQFALSAMRGEVEEVTKQMICVNDVARAQYFSGQVMEDVLSYTINSQMLLHNIDSFEEWRPPAGKDFVLCVEGITSLHGFAPHEAIEKLFAKWDKLGILQHLKHFELADVVSYDEKNSAVQIQQEKTAIEFLCDKYNVALVTGLEGKRTGHGSYIGLDPCNVPCRITVGVDGMLEQVTKFLDRTPPCVPAPKFSSNNESLMPPVFSEMMHPQLSTAVYNPSAVMVERKDLVIDIEVDPVNQKAKEMLALTPSLTAKVCGGKMYNVIDHKIDPECGLLLVNDSTVRNSIMLPMQDAFMRGRLGANDLSSGCDVPFVVIVLCNDKTVDPRERQNFIKNNEKYVRKFVEEFGVQQPLFLVRKEMEMVDNLFVGNLQMQKEREISSTPANTLESSKAAPLRETQQERIHE